MRPLRIQSQCNVFLELILCQFVRDRLLAKIVIKNDGQFLLGIILGQRGYDLTAGQCFHQVQQTGLGDIGAGKFQLAKPRQDGQILEASVRHLIAEKVQILEFLEGSKILQSRIRYLRAGKA